jgi:hypothetical protein
VLDDQVVARQRGIALTAIVGLGMIRLAHIPLAARGVGLLAAFLVLVGALAALRPDLVPRPLAGSGPRSKQ